MATPAACLVRDGVLVAAAEEERFRRIKHWAGFPSQAIAYCLREAEADLSEVDHIAINQDSRANLCGSLAIVSTQPPDMISSSTRSRNRRNARTRSRSC